MSVCSCYNMISKGAVFAVNIVIKVSYILGLYVVTSGTQSLLYGFENYFLNCRGKFSPMR